MAYQFRYRLNRAPEPSVDGSAVAKHDIDAVYSEDGKDWLAVGGRHKDICVPAGELFTVLDMPNNGAKVQAYKAALAANLDTQPVPVSGWSIPAMEAFLDANKAALEQSTRANEYITETLHLSYPVMFNL